MVGAQLPSAGSACSRPALAIIVACCLAGAARGAHARHFWPVPSIGPDPESAPAVADQDDAAAQAEYAGEGLSFLQLSDGRVAEAIRTGVPGARPYLILAVILVLLIIAVLDCVLPTQPFWAKGAQGEGKEESVEAQGEDEDERRAKTRRPKKAQGENEEASGRPFFRALSAMRYLMAWHVVLNNFYCPGQQKTNQASVGIIFSRWGFAAAPWFFMVSGFTHTYTKLVGPNANHHEDWFYAMIKKVSRWYPLVFVSLAWCALLSWSCDAEYWTHFLANTLLIHGLVWSESPGLSMNNSWWLCFLMVYLIFWSPLHQILRGGSDMLFKVIFVVGFFMFVPFTIFNWYFPADVEIVHLVQYCPSFIYGMAQANWFVQNCMEQQKGGMANYVVRDKKELPISVRFGAWASLMFLGICYCWFSPYDEVPVFGKKAYEPLNFGLLLPVFGYMICGLAGGVDPVAKILARTPMLSWLGERLAFPMFALQWPVYHTLSKYGFGWVFVCTLIAASIVGHFLIDCPWRNIARLRQNKTVT